MNHVELTGIVVCGGKSSRMGTDKSMLQYYNEPQRYHVSRLLKPFCKDVYLSLNNNQDEVQDDKRQIIRDKSIFENRGPMTALLSVYETLPGKNLLFIGCDYPLFTVGELSLFVQSVNPTTKVKAFFNEAENLYEPLLAYYPASFATKLKNYFSQGNNSLQKLLFLSDAGKYFPEDKNALQSVDNYAAFTEVAAALKSNLSK
jgi:molybdenum cofactor guanylyltransferase